MKMLKIVLACLAVVNPILLRADEIAIVTGAQGYLTNAKGQVVEILPYLSVVDVEQKDENDVVVMSKTGEALRISRNLVHLSSAFDYLDDKQLPYVKNAMEIISRSNLDGDEGYREAINLVNQALKSTEPAFDQLTPGYAWILAYRAYLEYSIDDLDTANRTLDTATDILKDLGEEKHLQAAEVLNVRGLVRLDEEEYESAVRLFNEALLIAGADLGPDHMDVGAMQQNLSEAYESLEDYRQALRAQQLSTRIHVRSFPDSAIELARSYDRLGTLANLAEDYELAASSFRTAIRMYGTYHPEYVFELLDARLAYGDALQWLEDNSVAEEQYRIVLRSIEKLDAKNANAYRKETFNRQGVIDYDTDRYERAIAHFDAARALIDPKNPEFMDGRTMGNLGNTYIELNQTQSALKAFETAIAIFLEVEGEDSSEAAEIRETIAGMTPSPGRSPGSFENIVLVAAPRGFGVNENGQSIVLDGFDVLEAIEFKPRTVTVLHKGEQLRVSRDYLRVGRMLPGNGEVDVDTFVQATAILKDGLNELNANNVPAARERLQEALEYCESEEGRHNTFWVWLRIFELALESRFGSPELAGEQLLEIRPIVNSLVKQNYPIGMDADLAAAQFLEGMGQSDQAIEKMLSVKRVVTGQLGKDHSDAHTVSILLATMALGSEQHQALMLRELDEALRIAKKNFPPFSQEVVETQHKRAFALSSVGNPKAAVLLLRSLLEGADNLTRPALAETRSAMAKILLAENEAEKAAEFLRAVHEDFEAGVLEVDLPLLFAWVSLGRIDLAAGRTDEAERFLRLAMDGFESIGMEKSFQASEVFTMLGNIAGGKGDSQQAVAFYRKTLDVYDVLGGSDSPLADTLRQKIADMTELMEGRTARQSDIADASSPFSIIHPWEFMLLTVQETSLRTDNDRLLTVPAGTTLWSLGLEGDHHRVYLADRGQYARVRANDVVDQSFFLMQQIAAAAEKRHANSPAAQQKAVDTVLLLQEVLNAGPEADPEELAERMEGALSDADELLGGPNFVSATLRSQLANLYLSNKQYIRARAAVDKALPVQIAALGADHPFVAVNFSNLANLQASVGDIQGQETSLGKVVDILKSRVGPSDERVLIQRLAHANAGVKLGRTDAAEKLYRQVITKGRPGLPLAVAHMFLGGLHLNERDNEGAAKEFETAFELLKDLNGPFRDQLVAKTALAASTALVDLGEVDEAFEILQLAEDFHSQPGAQEEATQMSILFIKAKGLLLADSLKEARRLAAEHLAKTEQSFGADHVYLNDSYQLLGAIATAENDFKSAIRAFNRARRVVHSFAVETLGDLPVEQQTLFLSGRDAPGLHRAMSLAMKDDSKAVAEATLEWVVNSKNLATELAARDAQMRRLLDSESHVKAYEEWLQVRKDLNTMPPATTTEIVEYQLDEFAETLRSREARLLDSLPQSAARQIKDNQLKYVSVGELRKAIAKDEVLVEISVVRNTKTDRTGTQSPTTDEHYFAWIVPASGDGDVSAVDLGSTDLIDKSAVEYPLVVLKEAINAIRSAGEIEATEQFQERFRKVAGPLWKSLQNRFPAGVNKVIISADGELHRMPWAAIPVGEGRFLVEDFEIRHVSSGRDLLKSVDRPEGLAEPVIFADPNYGSSAAGAADEDQLRSLNRQNLKFDSRSLRRSFPAKTARLKSTAQEARQIQPALKQFAESEPIVYMAEAANEATFRRIRRPHTAVVSTHGFFFPKQDEDKTRLLQPLNTNQFLHVESGATIGPLQRCGLLLAGCDSDSASSANDGILTGEEIVFQDLRGTRLVVLSACETGIGDVTDGQGVAGLRQAFQLAGAEAVVSTLWSIEDKETSRLMSEFFGNLASGQTKAAALRNAQIARIEARRSRNGDAHPFFWAAFTMTGLQ